MYKDWNGDDWNLKHTHPSCVLSYSRRSLTNMAANLAQKTPIPDNFIYATLTQRFWQNCTQQRNVDYNCLMLDNVWRAIIQSIPLELHLIVIDRWTTIYSILTGFCYLINHELSNSNTCSDLFLPIYTVLAGFAVFMRHQQQNAKELISKQTSWLFFCCIKEVLQSIVT